MKVIVSVNQFKQSLSKNKLTKVLDAVCRPNYLSFYQLARSGQHLLWRGWSTFALTKLDAAKLENIFVDEVFYSECYGPEYHGLNQIIKWFNDWNKRGTVLQWQIKQFIHEENYTAVEWYFQCEFDGVCDAFDGVSIVLFNSDEKIVSIKEFESKSKHYQPYGEM